MKAALLLVLLSALSQSTPGPAPNATSVHLRWKAPDSVAFYNEMTVRESVPGSYFMACGLSRGYCARGPRLLPRHRRRHAARREAGQLLVDCGACGDAADYPPL